jgi:hypothetical protein
MRRGILMLVVVLVALSGCGGEGGTGLTSMDAAHVAQTTRAAHAVAAHRRHVSPEKALPEQAWEGMPCRNSAVITYGGCGAVP